MNRHRISPVTQRRVISAVELFARRLKLVGDLVKRCVNHALRWLREGIPADAAIGVGRALATRFAEGRA